jgi:outer membrane lipoprotein SlyB
LEYAMYRKLMNIILFSFIFINLGCSMHSGSIYDRSEMGSPEYFKKGVILSLRDVEIKGTETGAGAAGGAIAGGVAGSSIGGDSAIGVLGAFGGAILGWIVGHSAEDAITSGKATEFIIQPDKGEPYAVVQVNDEELKVGERILIMDSGKIRIVRDQIQQ